MVSARLVRSFLVASVALDVRLGGSGGPSGAIGSPISLLWSVYTYIYISYIQINMYIYTYKIIIIYGGSPKKAYVAFWPLEFGSFQLGRAPYIRY